MPDSCELHLVRDWESAWRAHVRPWLSAGAGLRRDFVVVPTRGQAHGLKLRCVREGLPLLGVEFLTPGLARQKARALQPPARPSLGRELLLLNLRSLIAERLEPLATTDPAWGWWKSLESDAERALSDYDELLHAGYTARDFPSPPLADVFGALERRVDELGYDLAPVQQIAAGLEVPAPAAPRLPGRLLIHGFTAEHWPEFFHLAALARRATSVNVLAAEPRWRGSAAVDEGWVEAWATLLGAEPRPAEADGPEPAGEGVARLWSGEGGSAERARVLVGRTRRDEMELVAQEVARLLEAGSTNIGVVFPAAGAGPRRLARLLEERGIPFNDLVAAVAPPSIDAQLQRELLRFHADGARLEGLLELWPRLRALNFTTVPPGVARDVAERAFDRRQTHALADVHADLAARDRPEWREVARVAAVLLPAWPARLTFAEAAGRFERLCGELRLPLPETWPGSAGYAERDTRAHPRAAVIAALRSFVPETAPVADAPGRGQFAPVTLTTRRRAAGLGWSDLILADSNAGAWPERPPASVWLSDEQRRALNQRSRFTVALFTADDRARFEKEGYADLARSTAGAVVFAAAHRDECDAELALAPNAWLERVLLAGEPAAAGVEALFEAHATAVRAAEQPEPPGLRDWAGVWTRRRDPALAFDEHFLCGAPPVVRPPQLAARLIERGAADPAELWFQGVLGLARTDWTPLVRARRKALGSLAHALLAHALRGPPAEGGFRQRLPEPEARARLGEALHRWRDQRPRDRYWDSFAAELGELSSMLLGKTYALGGGAFVGVELALPDGTELVLPDGAPLRVIGRMDLVWSDRPGWEGAEVDIIDFKTGADARLSVPAMARGASLQLGVYLAAAQVLGAARGRVWMVKPDAAPPSVLTLAELPRATSVPLTRLARHLATGRYGALTPDRSDYARGFEWPLACAPIRHGVLARKFAVTFPDADPAAPEEVA